jgi:integrase
MKVWLVFTVSIANERDRLTLSRFTSFMSARKIPPSEVNDKHIAAYYEIIVAEGLVRSPKTAVRQLCLAWNSSIVRTQLLKTRPVTVPGFTLSYALSHESFPFSFRMEAEAYLALRARDVPMSGRTPLRLHSLQSIRHALFAHSSALVHAGVPVNDIKSLADIASPERLRLTLSFLAERSGGLRTKQMTHITSMAAWIGRIWLRLPLAEQLELDRIRSDYGWSHSGIARKNRILLSQFDSGGGALDLMGIPRRLLTMAAEEPNAKRSARMVRTALAVEILLNVPLRPAELLNIDVERDIVALPDGGLAFLVTQHRYLSTRSRRVPLGRECRSLLTMYLKEYRPLLVDHPSRMLLPGRFGRPLGANALGIAIRRWCLRLAGVEMTPTSYRHFGAKHYLDENPGDFAVIRALLGHRLLTTTVKTYGRVETAGATRLIDAQMFAKSTVRVEGPPTETARAAARTRARKLRSQLRTARG